MKNEFSDKKNEILENAENIKSEIDKLVEISIRSAPVKENKTDAFDLFQMAGIKKSLLEHTEYLDKSASITDTSKILAKSFINGKCDHFESSSIYLVTGDEGAGKTLFTKKLKTLFETQSDAQSSLSLIHI